MLPAGPRGGQEQRNQRKPHRFQQERLGTAVVPAGEGRGWKLPNASGLGKAGMEQQHGHCLTTTLLTQG